jgi:hypothetical protein
MQYIEPKTFPLNLDTHIHVSYTDKIQKIIQKRIRQEQ